MDEEWCPIKGFSWYSISNYGTVRNDDNGNVLAKRTNQQGILYVGLCKGSQQFNFSVARLVANAFLPPHESEAFDTPINLDGNRGNNYISNLMWRPRWFAVKYHRQFLRGLDKENLPVQELETSEKFDSPLLAAICFGLLENHVFVAAWNYTHHGNVSARVWPTNQQFRLFK